MAGSLSSFSSFNEFGSSNSKTTPNGGYSPEDNLTENLNSMLSPFSSSNNYIFPASIVLCKINTNSFNVLVVLNALQTSFI